MRRQAINDFTNRKIDCLINFGVFTEGTDLPLIETLLLARPTTNQSLYQQMVGRGLRLFDGKENLLLIDCVGTSEKKKLCTAPNLIGVNNDEFDEQTKKVINGKLTGLKQRMIDADENPYGYVLREKKLNLLESGLGIAWNPMPGGERKISLKGIECAISAPDLCGECEVSILIKEANDLHTKKCCSVAEADDIIYRWLKSNEYTSRDRHLWDANLAKEWGKEPASEKQLWLLKKKTTKDEWAKFKGKELTKREASVAIAAAFELESQKEKENGTETSSEESSQTNKSNKEVSDSRQTRTRKDGQDGDEETGPHVKKYGREVIRKKHYRNAVDYATLVERNGGKCIRNPKKRNKKRSKRRQTSKAAERRLTKENPNRNKSF